MKKHIKILSSFLALIMALSPCALTALTVSESDMKSKVVSIAQTKSAMREREHIQNTANGTAIRAPGAQPSFYGASTRLASSSALSYTEKLFRAAATAIQ